MVVGFALLTTISYAVSAGHVTDSSGLNSIVESAVLTFKSSGTVRDLREPTDPTCQPELPLASTTWYLTRGLVAWVYASRRSDLIWLIV